MTLPWMTRERLDANNQLDEPKYPFFWKSLPNLRALGMIFIGFEALPNKKETLNKD